ncbi:MAG: helicase-associated domain-containing protein, partial [Acidimicrobiales bacterium]
MNDYPEQTGPAGGPLIVQSDQTLLLEIDHPDAEECRREVAAFAELERSPEHVHTYRITSLGLWNARAAGLEADQVSASLRRWSRFALPESLLAGVTETMARYGRLVLEEDPRHGLVLSTSDRPVMEEIVRTNTVVSLLGPRIDLDTVAVHRENRGRLKLALIKLGWPAEDRAGYVEGAAFPIVLEEGAGFELRPYQHQAAAAFVASGSGVVVLPCGAGKTAVAMSAMASISSR